MEDQDIEGMLLEKILLKNVDKAAKEKPIVFGEYCNKNFGIRYSSESLNYIEQLRKEFGGVTENMLVSLL
ncbi:hypothetical protein D4Q76_03045, partial [archaeon]